LGLDRSAKLQNLSKGGYARVGLALALAIDPEVLILDEPTSGLDLLTRRDFLNSMVELAGDGRTILICSHQIAEVERIASHVAILQDGKLLLAEPIETLKSRFLRLRLRYDGTPPDPPGWAR
jgi:ABC-2 type transport system ATP-binding protein